MEEGSVKIYRSHILFEAEYSMGLGFVIDIRVTLEIEGQVHYRNGSASRSTRNTEGLPFQKKSPKVAESTGSWIADRGESRVIKEDNWHT